MTKILSGYSKSAFLINSLSVENKEYIFAKDSMEKDY